MAFTEGTQLLANALTNLKIEFKHINFATSGDTTGEVITMINTLFACFVMPIGAPDGTIYLNEVGLLESRSAIVGTTGKVIDVPANRSLTFARDGSPSAGMQAWVILFGT